MVWMGCTMPRGWDKKYRHKRNWVNYNEHLVKRGELYLSLDFLQSWDEEIHKMNTGKRWDMEKDAGQDISSRPLKESSEKEWEIVGTGEMFREVEMRIMIYNLLLSI